MPAWIQTLNEMFRKPEASIWVTLALAAIPCIWGGVWWFLKRLKGEPPLICGLEKYYPVGATRPPDEDGAFFEELEIRPDQRFAISVQNSGKKSVSDLLLRVTLPSSFWPLDRDLPHDVNRVTGDAVVTETSDGINPHEVRHFWIDTTPSAVPGKHLLSAKISARDRKPQAHRFWVTIV
jgi:hypothetical protein